MKKRYILATATMMMASAAFVEMRTGWLFGSETSAAETGTVPIIARVAPIQLSPAAGRAPVFVVVGDDRIARVKQVPDTSNEDAVKPDTGETAASSGDAAGAMMAPGFDQQLPGPLWIAGASGWSSDPLGGSDFLQGGAGAGGFGGAGGVNPEESILRSTGTNLISTVPEPASWVSLIVGLFLVAINMRRRRILPSVAS